MPRLLGGAPGAVEPPAATTPATTAATTTTAIPTRKPVRRRGRRSGSGPRWGAGDITTEAMRARRYFREPPVAHRGPMIRPAVWPRGSARRPRYMTAAAPPPRHRSGSGRANRSATGRPGSAPRGEVPLPGRRRTAPMTRAVRHRTAAACRQLAGRHGVVDHEGQIDVARGEPADGRHRLRSSVGGIEQEDQIDLEPAHPPASGSSPNPARTAGSTSPTTPMAWDSPAGVRPRGHRARRVQSTDAVRLTRRLARPVEFDLVNPSASTRAIHTPVAVRASSSVPASATPSISRSSITVSPRRAKARATRSPSAGGGHDRSRTTGRSPAGGPG